MRHPRESVAIMTAVAATIIVFINALYLQRGPHPAPIFASTSLTREDRLPVLPYSRPGLPDDGMPQTQAQLVMAIQRELASRGFYDGAVDGIWGARTDSAARDFSQSAGIKVEPEASDALLRAIRSSSKAGPQAASRPADPIAQLLTPSKRVLAVQRALADFGYGQIRLTGTEDADTRAAIEKFERSRKLPVTGRISDRLVRELAAVTGRPLE